MIEYQTTDQMEMAYIVFYGKFPYSFDRSNQHKVVMIVEGDGELVKQKIDEMWQDSKNTNDFRRHINAFKALKQMLWVDGRYDPSQSRKNNNDYNK
jgi:hypothetical protein